MTRAVTILTIVLVGSLLAPPTTAAQPVKRVEYYHLDALGSVRAVTDQQGHEIERHDYLPFGEEWPQPTFRLTPLFSGKQRDAESAFDYVGARYYASGNGRFTTVDPGHVGGDIFNPQSWNAYTYALNNPLRFVDPLGTCSQDAKGNYVDADDGGTLVAPGPCPRGKDGALAIGVTETVSVKSKPAIVVLAEGISVGAEPVADPRFIAGFYGASALVGAAGAAGSIALSSGTLTTLAIGASPLLPAVPSAIDKLQRIGLSVQQASRIATSPASQRFIDTANANNINVIQQVGDKLVRITLDPTGQRIISAGYVQGRNVANSVASGRFIPQ